MVGYDLRAQHSSEKDKNAAPVISKNETANFATLYQAGQIASTPSSHFIRYFNRLLSDRQHERGIQTKMRVKLAVKMLKIAWTLMKKQGAFDPDHMVIA